MIYTHKMRRFLRKGRGIQVLETSAGVFLKIFKIETSEEIFITKPWGKFIYLLVFVKVDISQQSVDLDNSILNFSSLDTE